MGFFSATEARDRTTRTGVVASWFPRRFPGGVEPARHAHADSARHRRRQRSHLHNRAADGRVDADGAVQGVRQRRARPYLTHTGRLNADLLAFIKS
jgi:hypothetical protein